MTRKGRGGQQTGVRAESGVGMGQDGGLGVSGEDGLRQAWEAVFIRCAISVQQWSAR